MKNNIFQIITAILLFSIGLVACQPETFELGDAISKEALKYSITQDTEDPNMVLLESMTPGAQPHWITPLGRSTRVKDTVKLAFPGIYDFAYGVMSEGGYIQDDTMQVEITTTNFEYINDPLWDLLTGGIDNEKTWIADNGKYGMAPGAMSYADPSVTQEFNNFTPNWEPEGNAFGSTDEDMGWGSTMTFSLKGGAYITTNKLNEGGIQESGTYVLNVDNHTLTTTDATILRADNFIENVDNWNNGLKVLALTENQLRIATMRTNDEGPWYYIWNYVSKEYADNYEPENVPDPNFNHGDQKLILAGITSNNWKLSSTSPFNWSNLDGSMMNSWYNPTDYPDWTGFNAEAVANYENVRLSFTSTGDAKLVQNDGSVEIGTYSVEEETNLVTFDGFKPSIYISGGWVTATTTDYFEDENGNVITGDNQWKLVKVKTQSGITTDIWFGKRDTGKSEYMVYHFELDTEIPDFTRELTKSICGGLSNSERTFKIDTNWPVDWVNPWGEGWTVPGEKADWYWNDEIEASVVNQTLTFSVDASGNITATKVDAEKNTTTSSVVIDAVNRKIVMSETDIIKFGGGSWMNTDGPDYYITSSDLHLTEDNGIWIGVKNNDVEYITYHYILKE